MAHSWQWQACVADETGPARGSAYTIIRFNTATGDYDRAAMDRQKFDESMRLWRAARQKSTLLNPDDQHGRQCNTHQYLHASGILVSRYLGPYVAFLVDPGRRPCDYDEKCKSARRPNAVVCAHTQFLHKFPVLVDGDGHVVREFYPAARPFNDLMSTLANTVTGRQDALAILDLFMAFNDVTKFATEDLDGKGLPCGAVWGFKVVLGDEAAAGCSDLANARITVMKDATISVASQ